ncbi:MAG: amino acid permease [Candidatus Acidiferrales bacterium]
MTHETTTEAPAANRTDALLERQGGLQRQLTPRQMAMIAIGGAIGTGLFLGSGLAVKLAGPGVILSYAFGAVIALLLMWALAEMAVAHPVAGSFGVYAEMYVHPWAGFTMRYSYWLAQAVAIGSQVVAAAIYCKFWFPNVPAIFWIAGFSAALIYVNARSVGSFGEFEYWFAMIKVVTIVVFLVLGAAMLFGVGFDRVGTVNFTAHGGFLPNGWTGVLLATSMAIFSFIGVEAVAIGAGEARDPQSAVPRALRSTLWRLAVFYIGGTAVLIGVMPWPEAGLTESPFVRVFRTVGIPAAADVMNFVVLTAALSSMNTNLYITTRVLFSLSRSGYAPAALGKIDARGVPLMSLGVSSVGMIAAMALQLWFGETEAYVSLLGAALFGGLYAWLLVFVTHLRFRRAYHGPAAYRAPWYPWASAAGLACLSAVTISTWWVPGMKITLLAGLPWLVVISLCYFAWARLQRR